MMNELPGTGNGMIEMNKGIEDEVYEPEYLTGKDYDWLCSKCQMVIDQAYDLITSGFASEQYVDDNEGPCMLAYDQGMFPHPYDDCPTEHQEREADMHKQT
tara:strand:+ start:243 stop:545 length:303 start_codon:yes stop_codon:yes gene_type:complete